MVDDLKFNYEKYVEYAWDENTHEFSIKNEEYSWKSTQNTILIENKSKFDIKASLEYKSLIEGITEDLKEKTITINKNSSDSFIFNIKGKLDEYNEYVKVGEITIKVE